jgi:hypothetical protein
MATDILIQDFEALGFNRSLEKPLSSDPALPTSSIPSTTAQAAPSHSETTNATLSSASRCPPKSKPRMRKRDHIKISKGSTTSSWVKGGRIQRSYSFVHPNWMGRTSARGKPMTTRNYHRLSRQELVIEKARHKDFMENAIARSKVRDLFNTHCHKIFRGAIPGDISVRGMKYRHLIDGVIKGIESGCHVFLTRENVFEILRMWRKKSGCRCGDGVGCRSDKLDGLDELMKGLDLEVGEKKDNSGLEGTVVSC